MLNNKTVAVIVPAYNEEKQIGIVINTMPDFVDSIIVINDFSKDRTSEVVKELMIEHCSDDIDKHIGFRSENFKGDEVLKISDASNSKIILINHASNKGKGGAIITGYNYAVKMKYDCVATMDGDAQMDPAELESICAPIVNENIDYVKGNRLIHRSALLVIPKVRYIGNSLLSIITKIASGYWYVSDTQTGYTAISINALRAININGIYTRYGYCNDVLVKLNIARCTIKEVEIKPVYEIGENSKMSIGKVIPRLSALLLKRFVQRIIHKYFIADMHFISIFYLIFLIMFLFTSYASISVIWGALVEGVVVKTEKIILLIVAGIIALQSLMFAMWLDIQDNKKLYNQ